MDEEFCPRCFERASLCEVAREEEIGDALRVFQAVWMFGLTPAHHVLDIDHLTKATDQLVVVLRAGMAVCFYLVAV
jgi:hypothetical protein